MRRLGSLLCLPFLLVAGCDDNPAAPSNPNVVILTSQLAAANEVPAVTNAESTARGTLRVVFEVTRDGANNVTGGTASFNINLADFPPNTNAIAAHIHEGATGVAGPVRIGLPISAASPISMPNGSASNVIYNNIAISTPTQIAALNSLLANPGNFYFNVHTPLNPPGAVRGQLVRE